jgi:hypothetical protein
MPEQRNMPKRETPKGNLRTEIPGAKELESGEELYYPDVLTTISPWIGSYLPEL